MDDWADLSTERKNKYLRMKSNLELSKIFDKSEGFFDKAKAGNWDALRTEQQYSLLDTMRPDQLAETFVKPKGFFIEAKKFMEINKTKSVGDKKDHPVPKKRMILSARRDLNFDQALSELIDNSIDGRVHHPSDEPLRIIMNFDPIIGKGFYYDNAGGLSTDDVFRVFIPGETIEEEIASSLTIGSFAMGAKKAIFHISDGTTIFSALEGEKTCYASIPEGWENIKSWETLEGESTFKINLFEKERPLNGETFILFERLLDCPIDTEIENIKLKIGKTYAELLKGKRKTPKLIIKINNEKIEPFDPIIWGNPKGGGAEPKRFIFSKKINDLGGELNEVEMKFELVFGLLPGQQPDIGFGIDVYGNNRLYDEDLKLEVGFGGKPGIAITQSSARLLRGKLFILGPSEGIPWDTHKRKYITEHPVAVYIKDCFDDIYREYFRIARKIGQISEGTSTYLTDTEYEKEITDFEVVDLGLVETLPDWDEDKLPKWTPEEEGEEEAEEEEGEEEEGEEEDESLLTINIDSFNENQIETIASRFKDEEITPKEALSAIIDEVVKETTVIIKLTEDEYNSLCKRLGCSNTLELADSIKEQLKEFISK